MQIYAKLTLNCKNPTERELCDSPSVGLLFILYYCVNPQVSPQFYHLPCHGRTYAAPFETDSAPVQHLRKPDILGLITFFFLLFKPFYGYKIRPELLHIFLYLFIGKGTGLPSSRNTPGISIQPSSLTKAFIH